MSVERAREDGEAADESAGLEAAVEDVRGQDGVGPWLVFGVFGVGEEAGHGGLRVGISSSLSFLRLLLLPLCFSRCCLSLYVSLARVCECVFSRQVDVQPIKELQLGRG